MQSSDMVREVLSNSTLPLSCNLLCFSLLASPFSRVNCRHMQACHRGLLHASTVVLCRLCEESKVVDNDMQALLSSAGCVNYAGSLQCPVMSKSRMQGMFESKMEAG